MANDKSRETFLFGNINAEQMSTEKANNAIGLLEETFGGGEWDPEKSAALHEGDVFRFPSREDIINGTAGKWVTYESLPTKPRGYKVLLTVNGKLKLVSHKTLNKGYRLPSDPNKTVVNPKDQLRKAFAASGYFIGEQLRSMAWLQAKGYIHAWRVDKVLQTTVLKFKEQVATTTTRDLICVALDESLQPISLKKSWFDEWNKVRNTYALAEGNADLTTAANDDEF